MRAHSGCRTERSPRQSAPRSPGTPSPPPPCGGRANVPGMAGTADTREIPSARLLPARERIPPARAAVFVKDTTACSRFRGARPQTRTHHQRRDPVFAPSAIVSRSAAACAFRQNSHSKFSSSVQSLYEPRSMLETSETQSKPPSVSCARIQSEKFSHLHKESRALRRRTPLRFRVFFAADEQTQKPTFQPSLSSEAATPT